MRPGPASTSFIRSDSRAAGVDEHRHARAPVGHPWRGIFDECRLDECRRRWEHDEHREAMRRVSLSASVMLERSRRLSAFSRSLASSGKTGSLTPERLPKSVWIPYRSSPCRFVWTAGRSSLPDRVEAHALDGSSMASMASIMLVRRAKLIEKRPQNTMFNGCAPIGAWHPRCARCARCAPTRVPPASTSAR